MLKIISRSIVKRASVTFSINLQFPMKQKKTVEDLSQDLLQWAEMNMPKHLWPEIYPSPIASDGSDFEKPTGIINWYLPKNINFERVIPFVEEAINKKLKPQGIQTEKFAFDESGMFNANVVRIPVVTNPTANLEKSPELNISNRNAEAFFNLLGLEFQPQGELSVESLEERIPRARQKIKHFTLGPRKYKSPTSEDASEEESEITDYTGMDFGISEQQLFHYLDTLQQMINFAKSIDARTIVWY